MICQDSQGKVAILYKDNPLDYIVFHKRTRQSGVVTSKQVDHLALNQSKAHKPALNHPWAYRPRHFVQTGDISIKS